MVVIRYVFQHNSWKSATCGCQAPDASAKMAKRVVIRGRVRPRSTGGHNERESGEVLVGEFRGDFIFFN